MKGSGYRFARYLIKEEVGQRVPTAKMGVELNKIKEIVREVQLESFKC